MLCQFTWDFNTVGTSSNNQYRFTSHCFFKLYKVVKANLWIIYSEIFDRWVVLWSCSNYKIVIFDSNWIWRFNSGDLNVVFLCNLGEHCLYKLDWNFFCWIAINYVRIPGDESVKIVGVMNAWGHRTDKFEVAILVNQSYFDSLRLVSSTPQLRYKFLKGKNASKGATNNDDSLSKSYIWLFLFRYS